MTIGYGEQERLRESIERARRGDGAAVERLLAHYRPAVHAYVLRHMPGAARRWTDAEDIVQAVLIEVLPQLARLPHGSGPAEVLRRLRRTARLRTLDAGRNHDRHVGESVFPNPREVQANVPRMGPVTARDYQHWFEELVARLPAGYAEVVRLCALEELSYVDAAKRLRLKPDTVRKRYETARKALERRWRRSGDV